MSENEVYDDGWRADVVPTPEQWLDRLFALPRERQLTWARTAILAGHEATTCFVRNHVEQIERLQNENARLRAELAAPVAPPVDSERRQS